MIAAQKPVLQMVLVTALLAGCGTDRPLIGPATRTIIPDHKWDMVIAHEGEIFYTDIITWGDQAVTWQLIYVGVSNGLAQVDQLIRRGTGPYAPVHYRRSFQLRLPQEKEGNTHIYTAIIPYQPFSGNTVPKTNALYMIQVSLLRVNGNTAYLDVVEPALDLERLAPFSHSGQHQTAPTDGTHPPEI